MAALLEMGVTVGDNMGDYADAIRSIGARSDTLRASVMSREEYAALEEKLPDMLYLLQNGRDEITAMYIGDLPLKFVAYE